MAYQQADLDRIERAIAGSVLTVDVGGKRVTYRSTEDLLRAREVVSQALADHSHARPVRRVVIVARKDL